MWRKLTIRWVNTMKIPNKTEWEYDGSTTKDSEALHQALCECNPGSSYTVTFMDMDDTDTDKD